MKRTISYMIGTWLVIIGSFLAVNTAFSQTDQGDTTTIEGTTTHNKSRYVKGITPSRARTLVAVAIGLSGLVLGWRARKRALITPGSGRSGVLVALVLGVGVFAFSVIHLALTKGDFGTGGGKAGAIVAMILGLFGTILNSLTLRKMKIRL